MTLSKAYQVFLPPDLNSQSNDFRTYKTDKPFNPRRKNETEETYWSLPTRVPDLASPMYCIWRHHSFQPTRRMERTVLARETMVVCDRAGEHHARARSLLAGACSNHPALICSVIRSLQSRSFVRELPRKAPDGICQVHSTRTTCNGDSRK